MYTTSQQEAADNDKHGWHSETMPCFVMSPALRFRLTFENLSYGDVKEKSANKLAMQTHTYNNPSDSHVTITRTFTFQKSQEATFEWGLSQNIHFSQSTETSIEGGVSIPLIATGSMSFKAIVGWGVEAGSHQTWTQTETQTETQTVSFEETITIEPGANGSVSGYVDWAKNQEQQFTLTIAVTATLGGSPVPAADLAPLVRLLQPDLNIVEQTLNEVRATLLGTFVGSYGYNTLTSVEPAEGPAPKTTYLADTLNSALEGGTGTWG